MHIEFQTAKLKKDCETPLRAQRRWGEEGGRTVARRLDQVRAAECLGDLGPEPPFRRHKLIGRRRGQYALDLIKGLRLVLQPLTHEGQPDMTSEPSSITRVRIMEVTDYHD